MNLIFVPEAQGEFLDAISYYEEAREGLGQRFKDETDRCILWVAEHSGLYRVRAGGYRRINLRAFPYYKKVGKFQPSASVARIASQSSVLTIHPDPSKAYDSATLVRFTVSSKLVPNMKACLLRCGINPASVFPGLEGIAKSLLFD